MKPYKEDKEFEGGKKEIIIGTDSTEAEALTF